MSDLKFLPAICVALLLLQSCITDHKLVRHYEQSASFTGYPEKLDVEGTFRNVGEKDTTETLLSYIIQNKASDEFDVYKPRTLQAASISIRYDGRRRLIVTVHDSARHLSPFSLRVKNRGKYLSVHRKTFLLPLPGFVMYTNHKMLLFKSHNYLVVVAGRGSFAEVLVIIPALKKFFSIGTFEML